MARLFVRLGLLASLVIAWGVLPTCGAGDCGMSCCKENFPSPVLAQEAGCCRVAPASGDRTPAAGLNVQPVRTRDAGQAEADPAHRSMTTAGALGARRHDLREDPSRAPGSVPLFLLNASLLI